MPMPVAQEKGHLYHAETPDFHKGEIGKGVNVSLGSHKDKGTPISTGGDKGLSILKQAWNKGLSAGSRFKSIFK